MKKKAVEKVEKKARLLLSYFPNSYAMMTIAPGAADSFYESVVYLYGLGFRRITATIAYGKKVSWSEESLLIIKQQYEKIAEFYCEKLLTGEGFFFSPFDGKIRDVVNGKDCSERCHLGKKQMQLFVDGNLYACTQFVGDREYCIGDVYRGINIEKWTRVVQRSLHKPENPECAKCMFRKRCTHTCGCANRLETGDENEASETQCSYEKILIEQADAVADYIMEQNESIFMKTYVKKGAV